MKDAEINAKMMLAIGLIAVLTIATVTTVPAFSQGQSEKGKEKAGEAKQKAQENKNKAEELKIKVQENKTRAQEAKEKAGEMHQRHLEKQEHFMGSYTSNLNYTFTADGNATSISDKSRSENVTVSMNLSVWKSTPGLVAMDVMNGTIQIGENETYDIDTGHARYVINAHKILIFAHIAEGTAGNSTHSKLVKLMATVPEDVQLPAEGSGSALESEILSPQSKVTSKWFLNMHGEIRTA